MIKRIAITGPESTGKTVITKYLSEFFKEPGVLEFSRTYLADIGLDYTLSDIEAIARGQFESEKAREAESEKYLFCDTDFTVTKIWSEVVFGSCPEWINNMFIKKQYDLYLLCYPDLEWQPDPLRQNPYNRMELFNLYALALKSIGANYQIVDGQGYERMQKAVSFVRTI